MGQFQPSKKFRNALEQEVFKNQIQDLYLARKSQGEIAKLMGVSQPTVSQWIRRITKEWRDSRFKNLDEIKFEELERINKIESEMWQMWERSKVKNKKTLLKETFGVIEGVGQPNERERSIPRAFRVQDKIIDAEGNMEYMNKISWCIEQRCKITGIYATQKIAPTDPTGTKEFGAAANETLINKLLDMVANREEAANRLPVLDAPEWQPRQLDTDIIDAEEIDEGQYEVNQDDDPVTKALKRRALEQLDKQKETEND